MNKRTKPGWYWSADYPYELSGPAGPYKFLTDIYADLGLFPDDGQTDDEFMVELANSSSAIFIQHIVV